ncbi:MAG: hypothetical protein KJZ86_02115 [Caldilineaceae bacterium]|nr:hypothetical protein [Caldilineaceae bacterium]
MKPFQSLADYERFVYTLPALHPSVQRSTLTVVRRGAKAALLTGDLVVGDYRIVAREKLSFADGAGQIVSYGYEVWRGSAKMFWYDSQAHPDDPALARNHPHHKHIPPDIKHNRIPALGLSFTAPNLPFLIREVEGLF